MTVLIRIPYWAISKPLASSTCFSYAMELSRHSFSYEPLREAGIRLITLRESEFFASDLHCDISNWNLLRNPQYEAVSYAWGALMGFLPIYLDSKEFYVSRNLESALRHLRLPDRPRVLWVDAICINQKDLQERSQQVSIMGTIYNEARNILFWLGQTGRLSEATMRVLNYPFNQDFSTTIDKPALDLIDENPSIREELRLVMDEPSIWYRIWIVQEFGLAKDVVIIYGFQTFKWTSLLAIAQLDLEYHRRASTPFSLGIGILDLMHQRQRLMNGTRVSLIKALYHFQDFGSSDPRDRVFAMLSLVNDKLNITPNYNRTVAEVFIDTTRACILKYRNLDIISIRIWDPSKISEDSLPSWVPDIGRRGIPTFVRPSDGSDSRYSAGKKEMDFSLLVQNQTQNPQELALVGVCLGQVANLVGPGGTASNAIETYSLLSQQDLHVESQYLTGETRSCAFWRTLMGDIAGRNGKWGRLDKEDIAAFSSTFDELWEEFNNSVTVDHSSESSWIQFNKGLATPASYVFGLTNRSHMVMVPPTTQEGDFICCFYGSQTPHVVRACYEPSEVTQKFQLIGPAYVHGFMDGEAINAVKDESYQENAFILV